MVSLSANHKTCKFHRSSLTVCEIEDVYRQAKDIPAKKQLTSTPLEKDTQKCIVAVLALHVEFMGRELGELDFIPQVWLSYKNTGKIINQWVHVPPFKNIFLLLFKCIFDFK